MDTIDRRSILAIHAHPDDAEILAGGTLALLAKAGHAITIVTMTPGDCGSTEHTAEQISTLRRREAASAAALIGATYQCAEFSDLAIFNNDDARRRVTEVLRRVQPAIVLTASPVDYLADHENTSALVRDACFASSVPLYVTGAPQPAQPLPAIPHLYFMDPIEGANWESKLIEAEFCVDVASVFSIKAEMLARHASQRQWLLKQHGVDDYMLMMEQQTREQGRLFGIDLAEGFRRYKGHAYPKAPLLETLLAENIRYSSGGPKTQ